MAYTTKTKVENYLNVDINSSFDSQITSWISAVESYINKYTGRNFTSGSATRYFNGNGQRELEIDEFVSITTVQILNLEDDDVMYSLTEGKAEDFITWPYNITAKTRLILTPDASVGTWLSGPRRIKITAVWGFDSSVPADIELAATILLASIIEKGLKGGSVQSESLGDYSVSYGSIDDVASSMGVKKILNSYIEYTL